jgi:diguanylate cyclase (GGDEF)-like protein
MPANLEPRRVLLAALDGDRPELLAPFAAGQVPGWDALEAGSLEKARFFLRAAPCDAVLLDGGLYRAAGPDGLAWLAGPGREPVLLLAEADPDLALAGLERGADAWLPRDLALANPVLLGAALRRVARLGDLERRAGVTAQALHDCRRQVGRLAGLLWEARPGEGPADWYSQRHMLQRLDEEVARARRHGGPLTVVLGEVQSGEDAEAALAAERVGRAKRRCDVAGRYGLHGFMMLLPGGTEAEALACCRRLRALLEQPSPNGGAGPPLHAWFGVAAFSPAAATVQALLSRAEERLERARQGPGGVAAE